MSIPFSVLDLSPIPLGATATDAFRNTVNLARAAERLGYQRFWLAEHHNMTGIGSSATSVLIGHVAGATESIRVGSGGVMLPNHSPLVIAEHFGTLASLYPHRIDLGLGRAPGTDMATAYALRRDAATNAESFPRDVQELQSYFKPAEPGQKVQAVPGAGLDVPLWLLGSSLFSAQLAAALGLPFAFAGHFAPSDMMDAFRVYRDRFQPSDQLAEPYAMVCVNVMAAETDEEALFYFTSQQQAFINLHRGMPGQIPPPIKDIDDFASPAEKAAIDRTLAFSFVGSVSTVQEGLGNFLSIVQPDELMVSGHAYDPVVRIRSLELVSGVRETL